MRQTPHPPLIQAAVSLDTFTLAGEAGQAILTSPNFTPLALVREQFDAYRSALRKSGHMPEDYEFPLMAQTYIGANEDDAYRSPEPFAMWYQRKLDSSLPGKEGSYTQRVLTVRENQFSRG